MKRVGISVITLDLLLAATPALADRAPTKAEAHKIQIALTAAGYKSWHKIQYDEADARWQVVQARNVDGKVYNLELNPTDYRIYEKPMDYVAAK